MKLTLIVLVCLSSFYAHAQDVLSSTISWNFKTVETIGIGEIDNRGGALKSYGSSRVEWYDSKGNLVNAFNVGEIYGQWRDVSKNGSIIYEASVNGGRANISFLKQTSDFRITIGIDQDAGEPLIYEFIIENISAL